MAPGYNHVINVNGQRFVGTVRDNRPGKHMPGAVFMRDPTNPALGTYSGEYQDQYAHGYGVLDWHGNSYAGGWKRGKKMGGGVLRPYDQNDDVSHEIYGGMSGGELLQCVSRGRRGDVFQTTSPVCRRPFDRNNPLHARVINDTEQSEVRWKTAAYDQDRIGI